MPAHARVAVAGADASDYLDFIEYSGTTAIKTLRIKPTASGRCALEHRGSAVFILAGDVDVKEVLSLSARR